MIKFTFKKKSVLRHHRQNYKLVSTFSVTQNWMLFSNYLIISDMKKYILGFFHPKSPSVTPSLMPNSFSPKYFHVIWVRLLFVLGVTYRVYLELLVWAWVVGHWSTGNLTMVTLLESIPSLPTATINYLQRFKKIQGLMSPSPPVMEWNWSPSWTGNHSLLWVRGYEDFRHSWDF